MGIKHKHVATQPEGPDSSVVRPSNWNDGHDHPPFVVPIVGSSVTWTNMPSAATEFIGNPRTKYDLTHADEVRLVACTGGTAPVAGATLKIQYSTDESAWSDLTTELAVNGTVGTKAGTWQAVAAGAKSDVFLRILGEGGNGTVDPQFRSVHLQVR